MSNRKYYLLHIQYLGFRLHGWAKQPKVKTLHHLIDKTIRFILKNDNFKTIGCSRTDALVSANHSVVELFIQQEIDLKWFQTQLDLYLPFDIRVTKIEETTKDFNIINSPKLKEYQYFFAFGKKFHPFAASIITLIPEQLDIELMQKGALLFKGKHNFRNYCVKPKENTVFERDVLESEIIENTVYRANFFPKQSYVYNISSKGFMRNQIRMMMAQLIKLGMQKTTLEEIQNSLINPSTQSFREIAPASGLILNKVVFD
jgi:tRNA pseudouridine38-40 synthase